MKANEKLENEWMKNDLMARRKNLNAQKRSNPNLVFVLKSKSQKALS